MTASMIAIMTVARIAPPAIVDSAAPLDSPPRAGFLISVTDAGRRWQPVAQARFA